MVVVTAPRRFGFTPVDVFFGVVRERPERTIITPGDLLRDDATGEIGEFVAREDGKLIITPV